MLAIGGALQHGQQIVASLPLRLRRLGLDPLQARLDQFDIADHRNMMFADQVGLQLSDPAALLAIDTCQLADERIDLYASGPLSLIELVRHQEPFGRDLRGRALHESDLRQRPRNVALRVVIELCDQLVPVSPFHPDDLIEQLVDAAGVSLRSRSQQQECRHLHRERAGEAGAVFDRGEPLVESFACGGDIALSGEDRAEGCRARDEEVALLLACQHCRKSDDIGAEWIAPEQPLHVRRLVMERGPPISSATRQKNHSDWTSCAIGPTAKQLGEHLDLTLATFGIVDDDQ